MLWWSMVKISVEIRKRGILPLGPGSGKPTAGHWAVWDKETTACVDAQVTGS